MKITAKSPKFMSLKNYHVYGMLYGMSVRRYKALNLTNDNGG